MNISCLHKLQALKGHSPGIASAAGTASKWRWVFSGGGRPEPRRFTGSSDLYFTGHEDGRVRVWDVTGNVPGLLATVPFDSGGPGVRLRPVSCLQVLLLTSLRSPRPQRTMLAITLHGAAWIY